MNYNLISQLVANGMNGEEILPLLLRNAPQLASKIKKLVIGGWGPNEVLLALQKDPDMGKVSLKNGKPSTPEEIASLKVLQGRRSPDKSRDEQALAQLRSFTGNALKAGAAVGGAYLGGRALQAGAGALQGMLGREGPPGPQPTTPSQQPQLPPSSPIPPNPSPAPPNPSPAPEIGQAIQAQAQAPVNQAMQPQTGMPVPPSQPMQPPQQAQLPDWMGEKIHELRASGNGPQEISAYFRKFMPSQIEKFEKERGTSFDQLVQRHLQETPFQGKPQPSLKEKQAQGITTEGMKPTNILENEQIQPVQEKISPKQEINKGSVIGLPDGDIGKITDIRQGIATVNSNGKEFRRKVEDLIEAPLPEKDLADLYKDLISQVEMKSGEDVSRMVNWAGYDPKTNELAFVPHIGALYIYDNILPEDAEELTNILSQRKSTGENFIGAWKQGTKSPIGASMSRLIQKLQKERGGKGNEYKGKFEKIYDALELPKLEAKKKHEEERKKKKKVRPNV